MFVSLKMVEMADKDDFMNPFGGFFDVKMLFISMHIEKGEKSKHFSYPDYFTYPVSQHGRLGQRCPDNRGCTVVSLVVGSGRVQSTHVNISGVKPVVKEI